MFNPEMQKKQIERLVKEMNSQYDNRSDPKIVGAVDIGRVKLYTLSFLGQDGYPRTNYVTEYKGDLRTFRRMEDTFPEINKGLGLLNILVEHGRVLSMGLLAVILVLVIAYSVISGGEVNSTVNNLAVLLIGYLAGKGESKGGNNA